MLHRQMPCIELDANDLLRVMKVAHWAYASYFRIGYRIVIGCEQGFTVEIVGTALHCTSHCSSVE